MLMNSRGKRLWIVDETGLVQPVESHKDITGKPRVKGHPDWWVEEREPDWAPPPPTSLLSLTAANVGYIEAGAGYGAGGLKIGAGHKPQPYDEHGRYTGPGGGQTHSNTGTERMSSADDDRAPVSGEQGQGEGDLNSAEQELAATLEPVDESQPQFKTVAFEAPSTEGFPGGPDIRGPVTGPSEWREPLQQSADQAEKVPASVMWKNREEGHGLKPQMKDALNSMRQDVPKLDSIFISSGRREPLADHDPHAEGRGLDISRVNGHPVFGLETATSPGADRAREAAANLEKWARDNKDVNQIIGPNGGWEMKQGKWQEIPPTDPRVQGHQNHYHINVRR